MNQDEFVDPARPSMAPQPMAGGGVVDPRLRRRRRIIAVVVVTAFAVGIAVWIGFTVAVRSVEREVRLAGETLVAASSTGRDIGALHDPSDACRQPDDFAGRGQLDWTPLDSVFELRFDNLDIDYSNVRASVIGPYRLSRPSGTDYGVAAGELRIGGGSPDRVGIVFVREPGATWLVCDVIYP